MQFIITALPSPLIWVTAKEQFNQWCEQAKNEVTKDFLSYLLEYKGMLSANNTKYNVKSEKPEILSLLERVKALQVPQEHVELKAAILNLQGLIERDITKNLDAASQTFATALELRDQLHPRSVAGLLNNFAKVFTEQGNHVKAHQIQHDAVGAVEQFITNLVDVDDEHLVATVYAGLGNCYRKIGDERCLDAFQKARELWPENMVIANNMAIALSKINSADPKGLLIAEELLEKKYQEAKSKNLFVTPYYRADINIKLAGYFQPASAEFIQYIETAKECLATAKTAIVMNADYKEEYRAKGKARIAKLEGDLQFVLRQPEAAQSSYAEARELRNSLTEPTEKKEKFNRKIPNTSLIFNSSFLFRHPRKEAVAKKLGDEPMKSVELS